MSFSSLPEDFSKKCLIIGVLQEKIDYKLSNFQRTTNLTQHTFARFKIGADRDRTDDLLLAKQALSQLSYSPFKGCGPGRN